MFALRFSFPNPVNEVVARVTAGGVVLIGLVAIVVGVPWLAIVLAAGFALRVGWGPRFSPLALLASRVIVPRFGVQPRMVSGPPKRFAQSIGLVFSVVAAVLFFAVGGADTAGYVVLGALVVAATLESVFGVCLGCIAFGGLMRAGVIPPEVCERCNDIWAGRTPPVAVAPGGPSSS
jgi:Domain of unknown function (DUF4395)